MSYRELDILLIKEQANRTTAQAALVEANFSMVGSDFALEFKQDENKLPFALGQFGKFKDLPGSAHGEFKGTSFLSVNGIDEPMFSSFLKSSGFAMTRTTGTTTADVSIGDKTVTPASMTGIEPGTLCSFSAGFALTTQVYVVDTVGTTTIEMVDAAASTQTGVTMVFYKRERQYAPSSNFSDWKYLTGWKYTGLSGAGLCKLTKVNSILNDVVIEGTIGEPIKMSFTGKGTVAGEPVDGTYPTGTLTPLSDTIPVMLKASTAAFAGQTYSINKFTISMKNKVDLVKSGTADYGYKYADITDADIEVKLTVYQNTNDPHTSLRAGTIGTFDIDCGDTLLKGRVYSPNSNFQITDVADSEDGKINTWEVTGKITKNDLYILIGSV